MADLSALSPDPSFFSLQRPLQQGLPLAGKAAGGLALEKPDAKADQLHKIAKDFEAVFLYQMMKQMRGSIEKEEMFHGGAGEDIFTEMLDEEFSKRMAGRGSIGIADMLFEQLSRQYGLEEPQGSLKIPQMPGLSGAANTLQQKLRSAQKQVQVQDLQPLSTDL